MVEVLVQGAELGAGVEPFAMLSGARVCISAAAKRAERLSRPYIEACSPEWHWLAVVRSACLRRSRRDFGDAIARISPGALFGCIYRRSPCEAPPR